MRPFGSFSSRGTSDIILRKTTTGGLEVYDTAAIRPLVCGIGVFVQNFLGAGFAQIYGLFADGSPIPMMEMTAITVGLGLVSAALPSLLPRLKPK
jgi:hypothetical protein